MKSSKLLITMGLTSILTTSAIVYSPKSQKASAKQSFDSLALSLVNNQQLKEGKLTASGRSAYLYGDENLVRTLQNWSNPEQDLDEFLIANQGLQVRSYSRLKIDNTKKTILIAAGYLNAEQVANRLASYEQRIRDIAGEYSGGKVRWDDVYSNIINTQQLKLNVQGKIRRKGLKDPNLRVGLYLQVGHQNNYTYVRIVNHDYEVWGGTCHDPCRNQVAEKMNQLPSYYPRFEQELNRMLY